MNGHGQHKLLLVVVPVQVFKPLLVISRLATLGSDLTGEATTFTQLAMDRVLEPAPGHVVAVRK